MSTIHDPRIKTSPPETDPFRYGSRWVKVVGLDGAVTHDQVPLTLDDLLHPREEDRAVQTRRGSLRWCAGAGSYGDLRHGA
jgi:hypothetical protein